MEVIDTKTLKSVGSIDQTPGVHGIALARAPVAGQSRAPPSIKEGTFEVVVVGP